MTSPLLRFRSPNTLLLGPGVATQAGPEAARLGKRAVLVTDPGIIKAELTVPVTAALTAAGISHVVFDDVQPDPRIRSVEACSALIRAEACDVVIGLGGGSPMDVAKMAAVVAGLPGGVRDYLGIDRIPRRGLPTILIPTTAGTGSEATAAVVLLDQADNIKKAAWSSALLADVGLIDPTLTLGLPPTITADTGIDALVHAVEAYVGRGASPLSDALALEAARLIARNLRTAYFNGGDLAARSAMLTAATMAGMAFSSGGLGIVHALAYPIAEQYHLTHGRSNAVFFPHAMAYNLPACVEKYAALAAALGEPCAEFSPREAAERAVEAVADLLEDLGVSTRLRDYGIPEDQTAALAEEAVRNGARLLPNNPRALSVEEARGIYAQAW